MAVKVVAPQTEPAYLVERTPAQETLRRCLTDESVKCAFLAKQRLRGSKRVLAIVAKHSRDGERMPSLPRPVRDAIRSAITYGQLAFCVLLDQRGNRSHADALLAMPITLASGDVWGALVTVGRSPSTQIRSIPLVRELTEQLAETLSNFQLDHALPTQWQRRRFISRLTRCPCPRTARAPLRRSVRSRRANTVLRRWA